MPGLMENAWNDDRENTPRPEFDFTLVKKREEVPHHILRAAEKFGGVFVLHSAEKRDFVFRLTLELFKKREDTIVSASAVFAFAERASAELCGDTLILEQLANFRGRDCIVNDYSVINILSAN